MLGIGVRAAAFVRDVRSWSSVWGFALSACASAAEPTSEAHLAARARVEVARELLAAPCHRPAATSAPDRDEVFVEALVVDVPQRLAEAASLQNLEQILGASSVDLLGTPHLMSQRDRESRSELLDVQGKSERPTLHRLSFTPRRAESNATVLELQITLQLPNPTAQLPNPTRSVALSLPAREDAPTFARAVWDEAGRRSLLVVVRSRSVRSQDDLRVIFECKMRQRARARRPP